jgi:hypothetical protein
MSTTSIRECRMVPYEQYERARRLLVDALFISTFEKTTLGRKIRQFLDRENSSGGASSNGAIAAHGGERAAHGLLRSGSGSGAWARRLSVESGASAPAGEYRRLNRRALAPEPPGSTHGLSSTCIERWQASHAQSQLEHTSAVGFGP